MKSIWKLHPATTVSVWLVDAVHASAAASASAALLKSAQLESACTLESPVAVYAARVSSRSAAADDATVKCAVTVSPDCTWPQREHVAVVVLWCVISNQ